MRFKGKQYGIRPGAPVRWVFLLIIVLPALACTLSAEGSLPTPVAGEDLVWMTNTPTEPVVAGWKRWLRPSYRLTVTSPPRSLMAFSISGRSA